MGKESKFITVLNENFLMEGADYSSVFKEDYLADILSRRSISTTLNNCLVLNKIEVPYLHNYIEDILNGNRVGYGDKLETLTFSIDRASQFGFTKIVSYPYEHLSYYQVMDFARLDEKIRREFKHSNQKWLQLMIVQLCKLGFDDFKNVDFEACNSDYFLYASSLFCLAKNGKDLNDLRKKISKNYIPYDLASNYKEVLQVTAIMGELLEVKYKDIFQKLLKDFTNIKPDLKRFDKETHHSICESNLNSIITSLVKRAGLETEVNAELNMVKLRLNDKEIRTDKEIDQIGMLDCFKFYFAYLLKNNMSTKSVHRLYNTVYSKVTDDCGASNFKKFNNLIATIIGFEQCGGSFEKVVNLFQKFGKSYKPKIFMSKIEEIKDLVYLKALDCNLEHISQLLNKKGIPLHEVRNSLFKTILLACQLKDFDFEDFANEIIQQDGIIDYVKLENYESKIFRDYVIKKEYTL